MVVKPLLIFEFPLALDLRPHEKCDGCTNNHLVIEVWGGRNSHADTPWTPVAPFAPKKHGIPLR